MSKTNSKANHLVVEEVAGFNEVIMVVAVIGEEVEEEEGVREAEVEVEKGKELMNEHTTVMKVQ